MQNSESAIKKIVRLVISCPCLLELHKKCCQGCVPAISEGAFCNFLGHILHGRQ